MKKHVMVKILLMLPVLIVLCAGQVASASSSSEETADAPLGLIKLASIKEVSPATISASPKLPDLDLGHRHKSTRLDLAKSRQGCG